MAPRHRPLVERALLLAERGRGSMVAPDTVEAFRLAVRLGATGIRSDAWLTRDGTVVLAATRSVGGPLRRRRIDACDRDELAAQVTTLADVYEGLPAGTAVVLAVEDPAVAAPVVEVADAHDAAGDLWLCHTRAEVLAGWRRAHPDLGLTARSRLRDLPDGAERHAAVLRDLGIDALELARDEWSAGLTTLCHRFGRQAWAHGAQHERMIHEVLDIGIDAVSSDHVDRLADAARRMG